MSILAKATVTTAPSQVAEVLILLLVAMAALGFALLMGYALKVFRAESIAGPVRLGRDTPLLPILMVTLLGGSIWLIVQVAYIGVRSGGAGHGQKAFGSDDLTDVDFAFLSTVPGVIAGAALIFGDRRVRGQIARKLGYAWGSLPRAILVSIITMLMVAPLMIGGGIALELLYRAVRYKHPSEHELLGVMKEAPMILRAILVLGACVVAPLFEEFLFRAHVQSVLVRMLTPRPARPQPLPLPVVAEAAPADALNPADLPPLAAESPLAAGVLDEPEPDPPRPSAAARWVAVCVTAMLFASVHPLWTAPLIFLLALCLGYAYERTGNLWVCILMHAIFNTYSTVIFLNFA